jgi:hypothetical protein
MLAAANTIRSPESASGAADSSGGVTDSTGGASDGVGVGAGVLLQANSAKASTSASERASDFLKIDFIFSPTYVFITATTRKNKILLTQDGKTQGKSPYLPSLCNIGGLRGFPSQPREQVLFRRESLGHKVIPLGRTRFRKKLLKPL